MYSASSHITPLMRFSSLTRTTGCTATTCSLQTQAGAAAGQAAPVSCTKVPTFRNPYSFNQPWRDGRLSWPCWLTDSGRFTHKMVKQPSISLVQDRESSPARTDVLTTMLRHHGSFASNLEQVANRLHDQVNSASYSQQDEIGKWVVLRTMGWRSNVADWGSGMSASCKPLVQ